MTPGTYRAKPVDFQFGKTNGGAEQVLVNFEIVDGEGKGKRMPWYGFFTEKTIDKTLEALEHCGWDGEALSKLNGFGSKEVSLVVEFEDGQDGKKHLRVRWVNSLGGGKLKVQLDKGGVLALEERLKGAMLARKQKRENAGDDSFDFGANGGDGGPPV